MYIIERLGPEDRMMPPDYSIILDFQLKPINGRKRLVHDTDLN